MEKNASVKQVWFLNIRKDKFLARWTKKKTEDSNH